MIDRNGGPGPSMRTDRPSDLRNVEPVKNGQDEVQVEVEIRNQQGLHARPVMKFVDTANRFQSSIAVVRGNHKVDGKSPMEMMLLEATKGTTLKLIAKGDDARQLIDTLVQLVESRFDED